jgi:hypothetical protein
LKIVCGEHARFLAKGGGSHSTDMAFPFDWPAFQLKSIVVAHWKNKINRNNTLKNCVHYILRVFLYFFLSFYLELNYKYPAQPLCWRFGRRLVLIEM